MTATNLKRRSFLKGAGLTAAAASTAVAAPAIAQSMPEIRWRLTSSFPKSLDTIYGTAQIFAKIAEDRVEGLIAFPDSVIFGQRDNIVQAALRGRVPGVYLYREWVAAGGLLAYVTCSPHLAETVVPVSDVLRGGQVEQLDPQGVRPVLGLPAHRKKHTTAWLYVVKGRRAARTWRPSSPSRSWKIGTGARAFGGGRTT